MTKAKIYEKYGIVYKSGLILSPVFGWIRPLLVNGNEKLGKGVWTFSTLAGNATVTVTVNGIEITVTATCPCNCRGCYAQTGNYNFPSVKRSLALKTFLARYHADFIRRAIIAQIKADEIKLCRIHASGDFFSMENVKLWKDICNACPETLFWGYTKFTAAEKAFNGVENCNIVKSIIPGYGVNFGHCGYIIRLYNALREIGKSVYICRCGVDKNQHCTTCRGCAKHDYVLFIEHSTEYIAENDPLFPALREIIESQNNAEIMIAAD